MHGIEVDLNTHRTEGPGRIIWFDGVGVISDTGFHRAIQIDNNIMFDNHNANGIPRQQWEDRLQSPYMMHVTETPF